MNDDRFRELLHAYRDGELPAAEAAALRAHLPGCAACRESLENSARVARALFGAEAAASPRRGFSSRVMARLVEPVAVGWPLRWTFPALAAAAAALLLILSPSALVPVSAEALLEDEAFSIVIAEPSEQSLLASALENP